jgi:peptidoglycan L-alanyl-D-glutamate endopeptidase CwlK
MSSRSLNLLHHEFRPLVDSFLDACTAAEIDILVTCTLRTTEEQAALYAQGRTTPGKIVTDAPPGKSAHQYGLAIDIVPMVNGKPDWEGSHPVWQTVGEIGERCGLQWAGAPGFPYKEDPHFQHQNWRSIAGIS